MEERGGEEERVWSGGGRGVVRPLTEIGANWCSSIDIE